MQHAHVIILVYPSATNTHRYFEVGAAIFRSLPQLRARTKERTKAIKDQTTLPLHAELSIYTFAVGMSSVRAQRTNCDRHSASVLSLKMYFDDDDDLYQQKDPFHECCGSAGMHMSNDTRTLHSRCSIQTRGHTRECLISLLALPKPRIAYGLSCVCVCVVGKRHQLLSDCTEMHCRHIINSLVE